MRNEIVTDRRVETYDCGRIGFTKELKDDSGRIGFTKG